MEKIKLDLKENQMVEFSNGVVVTPEILKTLYYLQWGSEIEWDPKVKNSGLKDLNDLLMEVVEILVRCNNENPVSETLFSGVESLFAVKRELEQLQQP